MNSIYKLALLLFVVIAGVAMAAFGFSKDTFLGLLLIGCGIGLVAPNIKNIQDPPPGYSRGSYAIMFVIAVILAVAGVFIFIYGIPS